MILLGEHGMLGPRKDVRQLGSGPVVGGGEIKGREMRSSKNESKCQRLGLAHANDYIQHGSTRSYRIAQETIFSIL